MSGAIRLSVPATTDSLAIARQVVAGVGEALELSELEIADLKLIISEACGNAVRHAYRDEATEGETIEIELATAEQAIVVAVRDRGIGFVPAVENGGSLGLGIPLMASLAQSLELRAREGGGVELRVELAIGERPQIPAVLDEGAWAAGEAARITVEGGLSLQPVLARMIGICAARVGQTVDELADSLILSDAVSAGGVWGEETEVALIESEDRAQLQIGPLPDGAGQQLIDDLEIPGVGTLTKLASEITVESRPEGAAGAAGEYVTVTVVGSERQAASA